MLHLQHTNALIVACQKYPNASCSYHSLHAPCCLLCMKDATEALTRFMQREAAIHQGIQAHSTVHVERSVS